MEAATSNSASGRKKPATDRQLVRSYMSGNVQAFTGLIERHRSRVLNYIMLLVKDGDLAQDIFQETFIKVVRFLDEGRYSDSGKFLPWVLRIARNQVIDHFRQAKSEATAGQATSVGAALHQNINLPEQNIEDVIISDQIQADIRAMIEQLPEEQREVVRMRYYYGMSFKEIADQTEVSINTALGRMRYALITMRKKIQKHNII